MSQAESLLDGPQYNVDTKALVEARVGTGSETWPTPALLRAPSVPGSTVGRLLIEGKSSCSYLEETET